MGSYVLSVPPISYKDFDAPPLFPKGEAAAKSDEQALDALSESVEVIMSTRKNSIDHNRMKLASNVGGSNFFSDSPDKQKRRFKFITGF